MLLAVALLFCLGASAFTPARIVSRFRPPAWRRRVTPVCGPRVTIYSVGKTKEPWLQTAIDLYVKRLRNVIDLDLIWVKDDDALESHVSRLSEADSWLLLDETGAQCTSREFSAKLYDALEAGGSRVSFFIGGAEGLSPALKAKSKRLLGLSKLTFTHQMARARAAPCQSPFLNCPPRCRLG